MNAKAKLNKYKIYGTSRSRMFDLSFFGIEKCPNCGAEYSELVDIDYKISPMIYQLNSKGYKTAYCCSGHDQEYEHYGYNESYTVRELIDLGFADNDRTYDAIKSAINIKGVSIEEALRSPKRLEYMNPLIFHDKDGNIIKDPYINRY